MGHEDKWDILHFHYISDTDTSIWTRIPLESGMSPFYARIATYVADRLSRPPVTQTITQSRSVKRNSAGQVDMFMTAADALTSVCAASSCLAER